MAGISIFYKLIAGSWLFEDTAVSFNCQSWTGYPSLDKNAVWLPRHFRWKIAAIELLALAYEDTLSRSILESTIRERIPQKDSTCIFYKCKMWVPRELLWIIDHTYTLLLLSLLLLSSSSIKAKFTEVCSIQRQIRSAGQVMYYLPMQFGWKNNLCICLHTCHMMERAILQKCGNPVGINSLTFYSQHCSVFSLINVATWCDSITTRFDLLSVCIVLYLIIFF